LFGETAFCLLGVEGSLKSRLALLSGPAFKLILTDYFHETGHVGVVLTAELTTDHAGLELLNRLEPHWNVTTRDSILLDPHWDDRVVMNHISRSDLKDGIPIHRKFQNTGDEVVVTIGIVRIDAGVTSSLHESTVDAGKLPVLTRIVILKAKLISDHADADRISLLHFLPLIGALPPKREGKTEKKNRLDHDHSDLHVTGNVTGNTVVVRLGICGGPELPKAHEEKKSPPHEEGKHKPVDDVDQMVNIAPVIGVVLGNAEPF
jgi:hypothetical protein